MKGIKVAALAMGALFLAACMGTQAMEVTYKLRPGAQLKDYTVYLVVSDNRADPNLVGANAQELFPELRGGRFDLKVDMPNGSAVAVTNLTVPEAVREAVSRKLQSQGARATDRRAEAQLTMEVGIDQFSIDREAGSLAGDLVARVFLNARVYRDASGESKSSAGATSNRKKLIGGTGGSEVLSEALSQTMNELDFSGLNRF